MRKISDLVSGGFIWSAGITPPKPGKERITKIYIMTVLGLTLLSMAGAFVILLNKL